MRTFLPLGSIAVRAPVRRFLRQAQALRRVAKLYQPVKKPAKNR